MTSRVSSAVYEVRTPFGARSGVAISANGRILTNYQAIADGTVTALLAASSIEPATVVGYNQLLDLVAIEIDPATPVFIPVKLGGRLAYTEAEAASLVGVERHVLRDARLRHEIEASRVGKRIVYTRDELLRFLHAQRT